jgi:hypothetical protein
VCQLHQNETCATPGLLDPISIPNGAWEVISMDFFIGLPGYTLIWVIVDKLRQDMLTLYHSNIPIVPKIFMKLLLIMFRFRKRSASQNHLRQRPNIDKSIMD